MVDKEDVVKRSLVIISTLAVALTAILAPSTAFAAAGDSTCRDIISGDPIYATVGGDAVVDVFERTAAADCTTVRYGLKIRPANEDGPTGTAIAFSWQYGDGAATLEDQGEIHLVAIVPGAPTYVCVQGLAFRKLSGQPRRIFDRAPDRCLILRLDGGSPGGGRSWD